MTTIRYLLLGVVAVLIAGYFALDFGQYASLEYFRTQHATLVDYYDAHPAQVALAFFALYVAVTALSLPGAAPLTLAAGAIFGLAAGTVVVSFASSLGATLAFLASRFLLRDVVQRKFGSRFTTLNRRRSVSSRSEAGCPQQWPGRPMYERSGTMSAAVQSGRCSTNLSRNTIPGFASC